MIRIAFSALSRRNKLLLLVLLYFAVRYFWKLINEKEDKEAVLRATLDRIDRLAKNITSYGVDIVSMLFRTSWMD